MATLCPTPSPHVVLQPLWSLVHRHRRLQKLDRRGSERLPDRAVGKWEELKVISMLGQATHVKKKKKTPWCKSCSIGVKKVAFGTVISLNCLCYSTTRRPRSLLGLICSWQFAPCHIQWILWDDKDPTGLLALLLLAASTHCTLASDFLHEGCIVWSNCWWSRSDIRVHSYVCRHVLKMWVKGGKRKVKIDSFLLGGFMI